MRSGDADFTPTTVNRPPVATHWSYLDEFPPIRVRIMARRSMGRSSRNCVALSNAEVAIASGLPLERIRAISFMLDWSDIRIGEARAFCQACGFDPASSRDRKRLFNYELMCLQRQSRPFQWLHNSPVYNEEFLPLIRKLSRNLSPNQHVA